MSGNEFQAELERLINRASLENGSNTPDFILAEYMRDCLGAFERATRRRDGWYSIAPRPGWQQRPGETEAKP